MPIPGIAESCHELNSKLLNDRIVRSVSEVVQKEIECYLAERLKDYSLYKDTYEQIMSISNTNNSSSPTCEELKKEIEDLKEQLNEYRQLLDAADSDIVDSENISLSIQETRIHPVDSDHKIEFVEPVMSKNIEAKHTGFWNDNKIEPSAPEFEEPGPEDDEESGPEDDEEEITEDEEEGEDDEDEEEVFEIKINGKKYYTTDEKKKNGQIFEILPNEDVGDHVGNFINGKCYIGANFDHLDRKQ